MSDVRPLLPSRFSGPLRSLSSVSHLRKVLLMPVLGSVAYVAHIITGQEKTQLNQVCCFSFLFVYSLLIIVRSPEPGRVAQSVGHLTRKSEVLGSILGLATYFRFSFR